MLSLPAIQTTTTPRRNERLRAWPGWCPRWRSIFVTVLVTAAALVHDPMRTSPLLAQNSAGKAATKSAGKAAKPIQQPVSSDGLPGPVADMREMIMVAVRSGDIAALQLALDVNEMKPELAATAVADPIGYWKATSADGQGREILAILWTLFECSHATVPFGKDIENNRIYFWPALAEKSLDALTAAEEVELLRLVAPADAAAMRAKRRYTGWRIAIGADGTWHSFKKLDQP